LRRDKPIEVGPSDATPSEQENAMSTTASTTAAAFDPKAKLSAEDVARIVGAVP